ncbi:glutamate--tRNA ligase [Candidatus Margulisiibacteriota bacterium]
MIKTRFAPSPTGYLHIGGARTALYNWLFARQNNGIFALRIEDTDTARSTKESADQILESMKYLGLDYDEGPIFQSDRLKIYQKYVQQLLTQDKAYEKDGAVYFKAISPGGVQFDDIIIGKMNVPEKELKDFVIQKSNGWPVYHFAVVVDDALMKITHVIRGMDHLSNTPKHILLFKALGFELPKFAHIPMILGPDKQRLSKRHGAQAVDIYEEAGIIREGIINFLARLGWGYKDQEVFSIPELLEKFNLDNVSKSAAVFDTNKLNWFNSQHISLLDSKELKKRLEKLFKSDLAKFSKHIEAIKSRCQTLNDFQSHFAYFETTPIAFDEKGMQKHILDKENVFKNLQELAKKLEDNSAYSHESIEQVLRSTADELNIKPAQLIHPLRLALSGITAGIGIFDLILLLGKEETIARIKSFQERVEKCLS